MSEAFSAVVVGLGGNGMSTVRTAKESEFIDRVIAVDIKQEACDRAAKECGVETSTDLEAVLADPAVRLVFDSTSNQSHHAVGKRALELGKAVCMEKPMGATPDETDDLLKTAQETKGFLQIGFELRHFSRLYRRVKDILDSGEIGRLRHVNCQYSLSPFACDEKHKWRCSLEASGGMFAEKLCHYVDLVRWWDGTRVCRFFATRAPNVIPYYDLADNVEVTYQFESGAVSHLTFLMNAAGSGAGDLIDTHDLTRQDGEGFRLYYQIVGEQGAVEANIFRRELRVFHHPGKEGMGDQSRMVRKETWEQKDDNAYFHNSRALKLDTARRVAQGLPPSDDPADFAETMRLCFEFEEALAQPWRVVER